MSPDEGVQVTEVVFAGGHILILLPDGGYGLVRGGLVLTDFHERLPVSLQFLLQFSPGRTGQRMASKHPLTTLFVVRALTLTHGLQRQPFHP